MRPSPRKIHVWTLLLLLVGAAGCDGDNLWVERSNGITGVQGTTTARDCVNVNVASPEELRRIIHIDEVRAQDLISKRPFGSVADLVRVTGIGQERLADIVEQGLACV